MFYILIVITLITRDLSSVPLIPQGRNVYFDFALMIEKITNRSAWDYLGYGCYCGLCGKGTPVDAVDRCCVVHDQCYDSITSYSVFGEKCSPHTVSYFWYVFDNEITCFTGSSICEVKTCQCDRAAVECFAANKFNEQYKDYSQKLCS